MTKKQIGIIGLGYLGSRVAIRLKDQFNIIGTTRSHHPNSKLNINHSRLDLDMPLKELQSMDHIWSSDFIIVAIPPSKSSGYVKAVEKVIRLTKNSKVILISSTSAFANNQGGVDEQSTPSGKDIIVEAEKVVLSNNGYILRLGGIVGPSREPWQYVSGKTYDNDEFLHLVHVDNCVDAIEWLINNSNEHKVFNIVNSQRILKSEFYQKKCETPPTYGPVLENAKKIDNELSLRVMNIDYKNF